MQNSRRRLEGAGPFLGAIAGLALAIALLPSVPSRSLPGQLPGYAAAHGFDPRADVLRLILFTVGPLVGGTLGSLIAPGRARSIGVLASRSTSKQPLQLHRSNAALGRGSLRLPAVIAHALTVWIFLAPPLAVRGISPMTLILALVVLSFVLAAPTRHGEWDRGPAFLAAACPILPLAFLSRRPDSLCLIAGICGILLPVLARLFARDGRVLRALLTLVLLPGSITALAAAATLRAPPIADLFEDGHTLLPVSEYFRGELPYRDIVPGHGLLSDGLLAAAELKLFGDDYRGVRRAQTINGVFFWPAFYAMGWAATGSAAFGFGALLLSFLCFPMFLFLRVLLSLWLLALAVYASRTKATWAWLACGAALPIALCFAVEFALYACGGMAVALWVARGSRVANLRRVLLGAAVSGAAIALALAAGGILHGFAQTTFGFLPSLLPVYGLGLPALDLTPRGEGLLGSLLALRNKLTLLYGLVAVAAVLLGALLPRAPRVGSRARAMLPVLAWMVLAMLSVIERQHISYVYFVVPLALLLVARWFRGHRRWTSPRAILSAAPVAALVFVLHPVSLAASLAVAITAEPPALPARPVEALPRALGGVFRPPDVALIVATEEALRRGGLGPEDTWIDFANAPGLYYLFARDCPIRYYEVPFYESEAAQREVIEAVKANPRVKAALIDSGLPWVEIDGIPNATRAPLVAAFLREHFHLLYREKGVEFWLRNKS